MTTSTPHLALPLIAAGQAQKHVAHNEALYALDALVHLAVLDRHRASPPADAVEGDRHIVAAGASGAWAGGDGRIAAWQEGAWRLFVPRRGWLAFVLDEDALVAFDGGAWIDALTSIGSFQNLARLGIGTSADATNPFAAKLNNLLWTALATAEGGTGDLRAKLSKQSAAHTLSLLFQSAFSGRAEIGLAGDDDLRVKVSADGTLWKTALKVDRQTGTVSFPSGAVLSGGRNLAINGNFAVNQRGHASGAALAAGVFGHDRWKAGAGGCTYDFVEAKPDTAIAITAGTLVQVVEDVQVEGGAYTLSWTGTAPGRVAAGAFAASPVVTAGAAPGSHLAIEFGPGTLGRVQLEPGPLATPFERRPLAELALCQRYYAKSSVPVRRMARHPYLVSTPDIDLPVDMRVAPTMTLFSTQTGTAGMAAEYAADGSYVADRAINVFGVGTRGFRFFGASGNFTIDHQIDLTWTASAEL